MAKKIELNVDVRERLGKGGAREARRNNLVPGVLYGGDEAPVAITLKNNELLKAFNTGKFRGNTVTLIHKGEKQLVIPQDIQFHPVSDKAMHVDLYRVTANQVVSVEVPVNFTGISRFQTSSFLMALNQPLLIAISLSQRLLAGPPLSSR